MVVKFYEVDKSKKKLRSRRGIFFVPLEISFGILKFSEQVKIRVYSAVQIQHISTYGDEAYGKNQEINKKR